jgi:ABC-type glycerol-3-phosphate transport system substrate-binding protein
VRNVRRVAAAAVALSLVAAACGSDDDSGATEDTDASGTTAETTADGGGDDAGGVEIRWRTRPDNDAEAAVYASISDQIDAANEAFSLSYEPGTNEGSPYQDQLVTEIANGTAPDVFWIPAPTSPASRRRG